MKKITYNGKEYRSVTQVARELLAQGKSVSEIAKELNVHYAYISNVVYYDAKHKTPEAIAAKAEKKRVKKEKKTAKTVAIDVETMTNEEILTADIPVDIQKDMKAAGAI